LPATAQERYRAVHWGIEDGLAQGEVYRMIKDVNGFLWAGTGGGLSRFDGSRFKNYYHDPKKTGTINAAAVGGGMVEDSLHNIWIGTNNGLVRYDIQADTFAHFFPAIGRPFDRWAFAFWATSKEVYCFEYDSVIASYDIHTFARKRLAGFTPSDSVSGSGGALTSAVVDLKTNSIWVLLGHGGSYGGPPGGGLLQVSIATGNKKVYDWPCFKKIPGHNHAAEGMVYDGKRNCLWINSWEGLMQFTLEDQQFHYIGALNPFFADKSYGHWVGISIDLKGRIWVATNPKGIAIYDPSDHSVKFPFPEDNKLQKEISDFNACIYHDRDGITWSGYWFRKGINQIIPYSPSVKLYKPDSKNPYALSTPYAINIKHAGQGNLWVGSFQGIHLFDTQTERFIKFHGKDLPGIPGDLLVPFGNDSGPDFTHILAPGRGLYSFDLKTKSVQPVIFKDSANNKTEIDHSKFLVDCGPFNDGFLFTAASREVLYLLRTGSREAHQLLTLPKHTEISLKDLYVDDEKMLFLKGKFGYGNVSYQFANNEWIRTPNPLDSIPWSRIHYNKKDHGFWVVAEKQLIHYSNDFRLLHTYTPAEGLPDIDIYSLIADTQGNIWFNTDRSIHVLHTATGVISTLSEKDGFEQQGFTDGPSLAMGPEGDLYLGGGIYGSGLTRISPQKFTYTPSSVYVQSLTINQESIPLSIGVNNLQELSLNHFQNKIALETGIIDYYSKGKSHIRFQLKGFNENWEYEPANYTIRYDGLPPGNYTLLMQASNAANEFIGPIKTLYITISPPWWQTWWAYMLFALSFASMVWALIHYRSRALRESNIALENKVAERTNDLEHSLKELKETQKQLIQSEKMASLGELTAGIAHEIQNPLNFVNNFSEVSNELLEEMRTELANDHKEDAIAIADDVKQNLEKILHHGKRADAIVKGMLQHSRSSSGVKEPTDINALADEYLRLSFHGLRAKDKSFNATLKTDFDESLGMVNIVPQDIGRVILNLINNAFYAVTEKKKSLDQSGFKNLTGVESRTAIQAGYEPTVSVSTNKSGDKVTISVEDNGNGIPPTIMDKIFQPFFTTKPTGEGTGLGLSLSYDIIKAHGGELKAETSKDKGTTFTISLPCS